jgi:PAS domain-containing protein
LELRGHGGIICWSFRELRFNKMQNLEHPSIIYTENQLERNESKFKALINNLPQKIYLKNKNLLYISCNEKYARELNIKPGEIIGKTDYDLFSKDIAKKRRQEDRNILITGKIKEKNSLYVRNGKKVKIHIKKIPLKDEAGYVFGVITLLTDIAKDEKNET